MENALFLPGLDQRALAIAPDFVYLDTNADRGEISQADIFLVVSNLLAVARTSGLHSGLSQEHHQWSQSVYGQVLVDLPTVCPRNFRDYNDAVLRASFIRAASKKELNYSVDEEDLGIYFQIDFNFDLLGRPVRETADLEAAIHAGSTMVRVGTAIFGTRTAPANRG